MDYSNVFEFRTGIVLTDIRHFGLNETFDNGSTFRWVRIKNNRYIGIVHNKVLQVIKIDKMLYIDNISITEFNLYFKNYFGFNDNYDLAYSQLRKDSVLSSILPKEDSLRLLHQDFVESFVSAMISQNNNIARIKNIINRLCIRFQNEIIYLGNTFYAFPTLEQLCELSENDWKELGVGYRALGLKLGVEKLLKLKSAYGDLNKYIATLTYNELYNMLLSYYQVGPKVADFIITMTGSCKNYQDSFVVDVWIKRALNNLYQITNFNGAEFDTWKKNTFGNYSALGQQLLFYYYRNNN